MVSLLSNVDRFHTQCNASSINLERIFMCSVYFQLTFKNFRKKKAYTNCKSEKIPEVNSAPCSRF